jgi:hypothetical protein
MGVICVDACRRPAFVSPFAATAPSANPTHQLICVAPAPAAALVTQPISSADLEGVAPFSTQLRLQQNVLGSADAASFATFTTDMNSNEAGVCLPRSRLAARSLASPFAAPPREELPPNSQPAADPSPAPSLDPRRPPPPPDALVIAVTADTPGEAAVRSSLMGALLGLPPLVTLQLYHF